MAIWVVLGAGDILQQKVALLEIPQGALGLLGTAIAEASFVHTAHEEGSRQGRSLIRPSSPGSVRLGDLYRGTPESNDEEGQTYSTL